MNPPRTRDTYREIGEELAGWGKVILLETRGRVTGRPLVVAVGFVERDDGSVAVAAGDPGAHWALNLEHDPRCRVTRDGVTRDHVAEPLDGELRNRAIVDLILRYGTPAEELGRGPAFSLRPMACGEVAVEGEGSAAPALGGTLPA